MPSKYTYKCMICGDLHFHKLESILNAGVTSDCKSWPRAGALGVCMNCGFVSQINDKYLNRDITEIYNDYTMYSLAEGNEQRVFNHGFPTARSAVIIKNIIKTINLSDNGNFLDFGCGNGGFITSFGNIFPDWNLFGFELDKRFKENVEKLNGVRCFYHQNIDSIDNSFDAVSMIHALEHIDNPIPLLKKLHSLINQNGYLIIQCPNYNNNPFDLCIRDHISHFDINTLPIPIQQAGFEIVSISDSWITGELSIIAKKSDFSQLDESDVTTETTPTIEIATNVNTHLLWLNKLVEMSMNQNHCERTGIFGTAIAGTWLGSQIPDLFSFFVDEDEARIGKTHIGKSVLSVDQLKSGSRVIIALGPEKASNLARRLINAHPQIKFIMPPEKIIV